MIEIQLNGLCLRQPLFMFFGSSSFRRILLSRLLLVTVPVLLLGVYITYRKARSVFLETSRQNLTKSAVRKAEGIQESIAGIKSILISTSDTVVLKSGSSPQKQIFLEALSREMPSDNQCLQLIDLATHQLVGNTCKNQTTPPFPPNIWAKTSPYLITKAADIYIQNLLPAPGMEPLINSRRLPLQFLAPVYDDLGKLKYAISLQISLIDRRKKASTSLEGYPVIINENGVILAHPYIEKVGTSIQQQADAIRLESLVKNAIAGNKNFLHLFSLDKDNVELIAGYSSIASPITREKNKKWAILSITPIDTTLAPLREIRRILLYMVLTLMGATLLAILIIAHELARPIEKLRDYALSQNYPNSEDNVPPLSNIRELNQLTASVQEMLNHLKAWGKEIESSWQEAQNANRLKTEFLATTSHELRTPLNGIINCIRIVKDDYCDSKEEADDFLQKADDAAIHLLGIINDILEVSRIESGKLSVTCEPIELKRILKEVINIQLIQIKKKQLQLIVYDQQNDLTIYADPAKLKQVLINVLGNAIKFTESGSINISTYVREARVIISVKDTGIGIEPRDQPKLFRPFVMIDGSTTRRFGGTGLGLAISKNLMQMMMGDITLFSNGIGQGTTVEIIIPLAETIKPNPENGQVKKSDYLLYYSSKEGTDTTFP